MELPIEVISGQGQVVITDRIFPSPDSQGVELFAKGGNVRLLELNIWPLRSITRPCHAPDPRARWREPRART